MTMLVGKNVEDFDIPLSILNIDIHYNYDYALRRASYNGYLSVVKFFSGKGRRYPDHADSDFSIKYACENGHLDVVKFLIENGANIHSVDPMPIVTSSCNGHLDVVKYLYSKGAGYTCV